jgi:hypothetical protein
MPAVRRALVQLNITDVTASGDYSVESPSRSLRGSAAIIARRANARDAWQIDGLSLHFDAAAVASANAERMALARSAGYGDASIPSQTSDSTSSGHTSEAQSASATPHDPPVVDTSSSPPGGATLTIKVV